MKHSNEMYRHTHIHLAPVSLLKEKLLPEHPHTIQGVTHTHHLKH